MPGWRVMHLLYLGGQSFPCIKIIMYVYFAILTERMQTSHYKLHLGEEDIKKRSLHVSIYYIITNNSCIISRKNCTISTLSIIEFIYSWVSENEMPLTKDKFTGFAILIPIRCNLWFMYIWNKLRRENSDKNRHYWNYNYKFYKWKAFVGARVSLHICTS